MNSKNPLFRALIQVLRPYWFRGKGRLLNALVSEHGEVTAEIFGYRFQLDLSDYIQKNIFLGTFEPTETAWVLEFLKPGMTVVDVGANVGYYTALVASRVGNSGRIFSIEPSPYAQARLQNWVKQNKVSNVHLSSFALGAESGRASLGPAESGNHTPSFLAPKGVSSVEVEIRTLDSCMDEWNLNSIDLLKIDTEGYEHQVLLGAKKALEEKKIRSVLCEFNDHWLQKAGSSSQQVYDCLIKAGMVCIRGNADFSQAGLRNLFFHLE